MYKRQTYNKWHPSTVLRILNSSAYIGELVSGKTQTASYKGIGLHPVEKKEWHIVENAHEAIILKSDFEKVQARREQNKEKREMAMARSKATREKCYNHLSGMVYCGCCRRNMTFERRVHGTVKETHYGVFICKRKKNTTPCAYHEMCIRDRVYTEPLTEKYTLEAIYERFNIQRPTDFTGHSLSVSDVVVLNDGKSIKACYVDSLSLIHIFRQTQT